LGNWSGEVSIQQWVDLAFSDVSRSAGLSRLLSIDRETTFSLATIFGKHQDRVDVTTIVNDTRSIVSVCEVKLPGFSMDSVSQLADYMLDLRNSLSVRYVFGVLSTYEEWRIFWFSDTNQAAEITQTEEYLELCQSGTANDYILSGDVDVYASKIYHHTDPKLVQVLASVLFKSSVAPISTPAAFIEPHRMYLKSTKDSVTYQRLPSTLNYFSYAMPAPTEASFHILKYYHRGGDGSVALCTTRHGSLGVLKFPLQSKTDLTREADLWNSLWGTDVRVVYETMKRGLE
jgi:hypothetical protein